MKFDIFFSISQTVVNGFKPSERQLLSHFFDQVQAADDLGFGTAWLAESHLSTEVQKKTPLAVVPHFNGEIGINVDFFQMSTRIMERTKRINTGSAIMNILSNGGPIAAAERVRAFLSFHGINPKENRKIEVGFASGRFPFINDPYGIRPRSEVERAAWGPVMVNNILKQASEIFIRLIRGEELNSEMLIEPMLTRNDFRSDAHWEAVKAVYGQDVERIPLDRFYDFHNLQIVPREVDLKRHLNLLIGSHDPCMHAFVNKYYPVGVFNLSITSSATVNETNERMKQMYHADGGEWTRDKMPRTVLVFVNADADKTIDQQRAAAQKAAKHTLSEYWKALEGTLDPVKVQAAEDNALIGPPEDIIEQMRARFDPADRLMLWFDFHNHDRDSVIRSMRIFMERIAPEFGESNE